MSVRSTSTEFKMRELAGLVLADLIRALTGSRSTILRRVLPQDDRDSGGQTSARRRDCLAGAAAAPLKEGLNRMIPYFERLLSQQDVAQAVRL